MCNVWRLLGRAALRVQGSAASSMLEEIKKDWIKIEVLKHIQLRGFMSQEEGVQSKAKVLDLCRSSGGSTAQTNTGKIELSLQLNNWIKQSTDEFRGMMLSLEVKGWSH